MTTLPARVAPEPMALIMLSPPPGATRIPSGMPSCCAAAGETVPAASPVSSSRGSLPASCGSTAATAPSSKQRSRTSNQPVPDASPASIVRSPVSRRLMKSWGSSTPSVRCQWSASFRASHITLLAVKPTGTARPIVSVNSLASSAVLVSHHNLAARTTRSSSSTKTEPCCWPLTPMPAMVEGSTASSSTN